MANFNTGTGIPFGTIYAHKLDSDLFDTLLFENSTDHNYSEAIEQFARDEGWKDNDTWFDMGRIDGTWLDAAPWLEETGKIDSFHDSYEAINGDYSGTYEGVTYRINSLGGAFLVWVVQSNHYQEFHACSPCVPGAHSIDTEETIHEGMPEGMQVGYSVPASWLREE